MRWGKTFDANLMSASNSVVTARKTAAMQIVFIYFELPPIISIFANFDLLQNLTECLHLESFVPIIMYANPYVPFCLWDGLQQNCIRSQRKVGRFKWKLSQMAFPQVYFLITKALHHPPAQTFAFYTLVLSSLLLFISYRWLGSLPCVVMMWWANLPSIIHIMKGLSPLKSAFIVEC